MAFENILSPVVLKKYIDFWITEDIPNFDLSSLALNSKFACANIQMNEEGVLAGYPFVDALFKYFDCSVEWLFPEGEMIQSKTIVCVIRGFSSKIMMAERTALNILSRASGVATIARRVKNKINLEWRGEVTGTRKTSPGMKIIEKYAMYVGGISTHRYDLSSMIMLKDNHILINGSISNSIKILKEKIGNLILLEVECQSTEEALEAAKSGANIVMLDNFNAKDVETVSKQVKEAHPSVLIEVSGGINETNILTYTVANVDIISSSMFCQGYKCIDLSLNVIVDDAIALTPDIIEIVDNDANIALDIDVIDLDITDKSAEFDLPDIEPTIAPKVGIKRKIDDLATTNTTIEDSNLVTVTNDNTNNDIKETKETKKDIASIKTDVTPNKQAKVNNSVATTITSDTSKNNNMGTKKSIVNKSNTSINTPVNKGNAGLNKSNSSLNKSINTINKSNNSLNKGIINKSSTGTYRANNNNSLRGGNNHNNMARMAGMPMGQHAPAYRINTSTPRATGHSNMMRSMTGGMTMSFPGPNNHTDAFFHGATPAKLGSSAMARSTMGNLIDQRSLAGQFRSYGPANPTIKICHCCNHQNPGNGPPICRQCRNMLV